MIEYSNNKMNTIEETKEHIRQLTELIESDPLNEKINMWKGYRERYRQILKDLNKND